MNVLTLLREARWRVAAFLAFAAALNYADRAALSSVLPSLRTEFTLSNDQLGLLGAVFLWVYALASPIAGLLADRWSRWKQVVWSLALWSAVTAMMGAAHGFVSLLILRGALGLVESLYLPAATALLADHHGPATRGRAMSVHSVGLNFGVVLGGTFAGYLAEHFGWRSGFWVLGGIGILLAALAPQFLRRPPEKSDPLGYPAPAGTGGAAPAQFHVLRENLPRSGADATPGDLHVIRENPAGAPTGAACGNLHVLRENQKEPVARSSLVEALKYLARVPTYHVLLAKAMLAGVGIWVFLNWLPLYFREAFDLTLGAAGFAGTFMLQISTVLGIAAGGWVSDRAAAGGPKRRVLVQGLSYLAAAPFLLLFLTHPGFTAVAVAVSAFSLFRGLGQASENPVICEVIPVQYRSTALGFMNTCATAAGGLGVLLAGVLKSTFGLNAIFAGISLLFVIAGLALILAYRLWVVRDLERARECSA